MTPCPEVSVVMGVYNGMPHLKQALESILSQEGVDLECIVVDDGSTDGTPDLLAAVAACDPRVRVIRQPNRGLTQALIRGCEAARAPYIARQDADDISMPGRLVRQREFLDQNPGVVLVGCWTEVIGPLGEPLYQAKRTTDIIKATQLVKDGVEGPEHGSTMFRLSSYHTAGGYAPEMYYSQDNELWHRLVWLGSIAYLDEPLYKFRIRPGSISSASASIRRLYVEKMHALRIARAAGESEEMILAELRQLPVSETSASDDVSFSASQTYYFIASCLARQGNPMATSYLRQCIAIQPLFFKAWLLLGLQMIRRLWHG